jgi:rRNA pseudouridine-1189 N-methylase Emg1 (Nep1/Mra1 family)
LALVKIAVAAGIHLKISQKITIPRIYLRYQGQLKDVITTRKLNNRRNQPLADLMQSLGINPDPEVVEYV